ncbi:MAG: FecR family protein [Planctomycetes bacterium]|nr:FecR family protein [Planctomycetota bacterium]
MSGEVPPGDDAQRPAGSPPGPDPAVVEAWLAGTLDEPGCAALLAQVRADPALAAHLADHARLALLLERAHGRGRDLVPGVLSGLRGEQSRLRLRRAVMGAVRRPARPRSRGWIALAAMLAAAVALSAVLLRPSAPPELGRILVGAPPRALQAGERLASGAATLVLEAAGADLTLEPGTALVLTGGDDLALEAGALTARVAPRAGRALVFTTPQARAVVLGTELRLSVAGDRTRLAVGRGRVRLEALAAAAPVEVAAAGLAEVRAGAAPRALVRRMLFPAGLAGWTAKAGGWSVQDGVVRGQDPAGRYSRLMSERRHGDLLLTCRLRITGADCAEVQVGDYARFVQVPAGVGGWCDLRLEQRGEALACQVDGRDLPIQSGSTATLRPGPLSFYIKYGGALEIAAAEVEEPEDL